MKLLGALTVAFAVIGLTWVVYAVPLILGWWVAPGRWSWERQCSPFQSGEALTSPVNWIDAERGAWFQTDASVSGYTVNGRMLERCAGGVFEVAPGRWACQ